MLSLPALLTFCSLVLAGYSAAIWLQKRNEAREVVATRLKSMAGTANAAPGPQADDALRRAASRRPRSGPLRAPGGPRLPERAERGGRDLPRPDLAGAALGGGGGAAGPPPARSAVSSGGADRRPEPSHPRGGS